MPEPRPLTLNPSTAAWAFGSSFGLAGGSPGTLFRRLVEEIVGQEYLRVTATDPRLVPAEPPGTAPTTAMFLGERGVHEVNSVFRLVGTLLLLLGVVLFIIGLSLSLVSLFLTAVLIAAALPLIPTGMVIRRLPSFESWVVLLVIASAAGQLVVSLWITAIHSKNFGGQRTVHAYVARPEMRTHFGRLVRTLAAIGAPLPVPGDPGVMRLAPSVSCPDCGSTTPGEAAYCISCGGTLGVTPSR